MNTSIIFIILLVLAFIAAIYALFDKDHRNLAIFIAFISLFATLLGAYGSINGGKPDDDGEVLKENHENSHNTKDTDIEINNEGGIAIAGDVNGNIENNQYNEATDPITLESARIKLEMKRYDDASEIYLRLLEHEPENHVALCNLGYIYACGLDTDIDIETAREYYINAMLNGSIQALRNCLAMELYNNIPVDDYCDLIWSGIELGDVPICRFIAGSMQENADPDANESIVFCQNLDEIPLDAIFDWEDCGLIKEYSTPTNTYTVRYTKVQVGTEVYSDTAAALYTIYRKEQRYCPYIDLLSAGFNGQI